MVNTILVLLLSFTASLGFSVTFGIHGKDKLLYAGLGGFLVRLVNITLSSFVQNHFVITLISALAASLYGDMFHYMVASIVTGNIRLAEIQAFDCGLSLVALSLGTIIGTTTLQSIRRK